MTVEDQVNITKELLRTHPTSLVSALAYVVEGLIDVDFDLAEFNWEFLGPLSNIVEELHNLKKTKEG